MFGEATPDVSGTFAGEAIRLPIQIAALQYPLCVGKPFMKSVHDNHPPISTSRLPICTRADGKGQQQPDR
jgi:hypothetical protein